MHKSPALLKRWIAAMGGDSRYPTSPDELGLETTLQLQQSDPELLQLLQGSAPASLELQVLDGSLPDAAPTAQQRQEQANQQRIAELVEANVFGVPGRYAEDGTYIEPIPPSITAQFELQALAPELAAKLQAAATPAPAPINPADAAIWQQHGYATAS